MARKIIVTAALLLIIGFCGFYVWARVQDGGDGDNYFHQRLRPRLANSATGRSLFNLHEAGDARREYLRSGRRIELVVSSMAGLKPETATVDRLAQEMAQFAGKSVSVRYSDKDITYTEALAGPQLETVLQGHTQASTNPARFFVFFLSRNSDHPTWLGLSYRENAAVVYVDTIREDVGGNSSLQFSFSFSTALHEFGHQLGLEHNDRAGCLMNERADIGLSVGLNPQNIVMSFCAFEKQGLNQIKAR